jgi:Protein of unknown function (DUF2924)
MADDLHIELTRLCTMTTAALRERYLAVFGEPTRSGNKDFLCKRIAWRMQANAEGSLSERAKKRAAEIACDADIRTTIPRPRAATPEAPTTTSPAPRAAKRLPMPGAVLTREYRGRSIAVTVLRNGFDWEGRVYKSLSAVAKAITGSHWNGYLFFGLADGDER